MSRNNKFFLATLNQSIIFSKSLDARMDRCKNDRINHDARKMYQNAMVKGWMNQDDRKDG